MSTMQYEQKKIKTIAGIVELNTVAQRFPSLDRREFEDGPRMPHGLKSLSNLLLTEQGEFVKDKKMSISNWSKKVLTTKQMSYAATDGMYVVYSTVVVVVVDCILSYCICFLLSDRADDFFFFFSLHQKYLCTSGHTFICLSMDWVRAGRRTSFQEHEAQQ